MTVLLFQIDYLRLFDWVWQTSLKVSFLVVLLLLLKTLFKEKISVRLNYQLWLIVIVSLFLPWTPHSSFSLYNLANLEIQQSYQTPMINQTSNFLGSSAPAGFSKGADGNLIDQTAVPHNPASEHDLQNSIVASLFTHRFLFFIWLIGAAAFAAATGLLSLRFARRIQGQSVANSNLVTAFTETKNRLNITSEIPLIQSKAVSSPSLYGLIHPRLLIPAGSLDGFSPDQLNHIFTHELGHFKSKDILVNWLTQGLLILHWFNPVIWYAFYRLRDDQEIACDAKTIESIGINHAKEYAYTLIKLAENNTGLVQTVSLANLLGSSTQIRRRISMIKVFHKAPIKWSVLVVALAAILAFVTLTNAKQAGVTNNTPVLSEEKAVTVVNEFLAKGAQIVNPQTPEGAKGVQLVDLNGDGEDEIVALYKLNGTQSRAGLLVLKYAADGTWSKVSDYQSDGFGVNYLKFANITGDKGNNIVVGWNLGSIFNELNIFSLENNQLKKITSNYCSKIEVEDMDGNKNGQSEIALWIHDTGEAFQIDVFKWNGEELVSDQDAHPNYFQKVTQYYEQKVKEMPDAAFYWYYLADAQIKADNPKDALSSITAGLAIKAEHSDYYPDNSEFEKLKETAQHMLAAK